MPAILRRLVPLVVLLVDIGCARAPDPKGLPVLEVGPKTMTVADLESYIAVNLMPPSDVEGERSSAGDLDEVKSRLFDNFVDEELLFAEAERQGIQVDDEEIAAYVRVSSEGQAAEPPLAKRREMARRDLAIQKLRERFVRGRTSVTPDEVDAYLLQHRADLPPTRHLVLRSLLLPSEQRGKEVYEDIRSRRSTFDEAVAASRTGDGQAEPLEVAIDGLPSQVQAAVADLAAGQVSVPVVVQGSCYLFYVQEWASRSENEEGIRRRVRDDLLRQKHEQASRQLLAELRSSLHPKVELGNLPFRYVAETPEGK